MNDDQVSFGDQSRVRILQVWHAREWSEESFKFPGPRMGSGDRVLCRMKNGSKIDIDYVQVSLSGPC